LLSDISQARRYADRFPAGLVSHELHEVVRNTERISAAATAFQRKGDDQLIARHHHEATPGPPLRSYLFAPVEPVSGLADEYAKVTVQALEDVAKQFPELDLHDRLAIIVPHARFRHDMARCLPQRLAASHVLAERTFELKNAEEASRALHGGSGCSGESRTRCSAY
jgi:hypothetical protein